jgi:hypothetical protein
MEIYSNILFIIIGVVWLCVIVYEPSTNISITLLCMNMLAVGMNVIVVIGYYSVPIHPVLLLDIG